MSNRRAFFTRAASAAAALFSQKSPAQSSAANIPFVTPDLPKLPWKMVDGWKEFHLIAEPVRTEILPGRVLDAWGYNGSVPGPTIEVNQGDKVRIIFENRLPEMSAVHWHGFEVPMTMDGSVGLGQDPVPPGGKFVYEFQLHQAGTFFYHSHFAMQEMMGMIGFFIMHPKEPFAPHVHRDFGLVLQEWALLPNNTVPNTLAMEFNWLTFNGKAGPDCTPMIAKQGERVRIRLINMGMDHHPIHLHGNQFTVTGTEAGRGPVDGQPQQNTVLVGVAQARDIEFEAKYVGDWMVHCHLPHHMMNQMVSMVGPISHGTQATADAKSVPGFPQDMWMVNDEPYAWKPENHGLRKGWSGGMMGMMTMVRVVTPEMYAHIEALRAKNPQRPASPGAGHHHHHPAPEGSKK